MGSSNSQLTEPEYMLRLPRIWIGYLLGFATTVAEVVAFGLDPDIALGEDPPPLYLFLAVFVSSIYWLVCIHRIHVVLANVPDWKHSISPARAVGFHFIPLFYLYWIFKWPSEVARYVNLRLGQPLMKGYAAGLLTFIGLLTCILFPGFGLLLLFVALSYVCGGLRRAFAAPPIPSGLPPQV